MTGTASAHVSQQLSADRWPRLCDVRCPDRPSQTIDELVVGPSGLHVVLHASGVATNGSGEGWLRECAVTTLDAATAVGEVLPTRYATTVRPSVCLCSATDTGVVLAGVPVLSPDAWRHMAVHAPRLLSTSEITLVTTWLHERLEVVPPPAPSPAGRRGRHARWAVSGGVAAAVMAAVASGAVPLPWHWS